MGAGARLDAHRTHTDTSTVLFVGGFRTIYGRWIERGGLYRWQFAELISEDAWALALSDAVLVGTTVLCVPFAKVSVFDAAYS